MVTSKSTSEMLSRRNTTELCLESSSTESSIVGVGGCVTGSIVGVGVCVTVGVGVCVTGSEVAAVLFCVYMYRC